MGDAADVALRATMDTTGVTRGASSIQSALGGIISKVNPMTIALGAAAAGAAALGGALTLSVNTAKNFQQSMANVASVTGGGAAAMAELSAVAREAGASTIFSASQAGDAMYYLASAGFNAGQIAASLGDSLQLAAAGQMDLASSSEILTSTLAQFKLKAEDSSRVSNTLAAAASYTNTTIGQLGAGMGYVGPVAASLGWEIEDTTAALGLLANAGLKGERGGTALRGALSALMKPSNAAAAALGEMGLTIEDVDPATHKLVDIIKALEGGSMTAAQAVAIFGQEAGPSMLALVSQGSDALETMTERITGTNKAAEMAATQTATFQGALQMLRSALEEVQIAAGNEFLPALTSGVQAATEGVRALASGFDTLTGAAGHLGEDFKAAFEATGGAIAGPMGMLIASDDEGMIKTKGRELMDRFTEGVHEYAGDIKIGDMWFGSEGDLDKARQAGQLTAAQYMQGLGELTKSKGEITGATGDIITHLTKLGTAGKLSVDQVKSSIASMSSIFSSVGDSAVGLTEGVSAAFNSGAISAEEYITSLENISTVTEALGEGAEQTLGPLNEMFSEGEISITEYNSALETVNSAVVLLGDSFDEIAGPIQDAFEEGKISLQEYQKALNDMSSATSVIGEEAAANLSKITEGMDPTQVAEMWDTIAKGAKTHGPETAAIIADTIEQAGDPAADGFTDTFISMLETNLGTGELEEAIEAPLTDASVEAAGEAGDAAQKEWLDRFTSGMDYNLKHGYSYIYENGKIVGVEEETPGPLWDTRTGVSSSFEEGVVVGKTETDASKRAYADYSTKRADWVAAHTMENYDAYIQTAMDEYISKDTSRWRKYLRVEGSEASARARLEQEFKAGYNPNYGIPTKSYEDWKSSGEPREPRTRYEDEYGTKVTFDINGREKTATSLAELYRDVGQAVGDYGDGLGTASEYSATTFGYVQQIVSTLPEGHPWLVQFNSDLEAAGYSAEELSQAITSWESEPEIKFKTEAYDKWISSLPADQQKIAVFSEDASKALFNIWHQWEGADSADIGLSATIAEMMESADEEIAAAGKTLQDEWNLVLSGLAEPELTADAAEEMYFALNHLKEYALRGLEPGSDDYNRVSEQFNVLFEEVANRVHYDLIIDQDRYNESLHDALVGGLEEAQQSIEETGIVSQDWINEQIELWKALGEDAMVAMLTELKGDPAMWDDVVAAYHEHGIEMADAVLTAFSESASQIGDQIWDLLLSIDPADRAKGEEMVVKFVADTDVYFKKHFSNYLSGWVSEASDGGMAVSEAFWERLAYFWENHKDWFSDEMIMVLEATEEVFGSVDMSMQSHSEQMKVLLAMADSLSEGVDGVNDSLSDEITNLASLTAEANGACDALSNFANAQEANADMFLGSFVGSNEDRIKWLATTGEYEKRQSLGGVGLLPGEAEAVEAYRASIQGLDTDLTSATESAGKLSAELEKISIPKIDDAPMLDSINETKTTIEENPAILPVDGNSELAESVVETVTTDIETADPTLHIYADTTQAELELQSILYAINNSYAYVNVGINLLYDEIGAAVAEMVRAQVASLLAEV